MKHDWDLIRRILLTCEDAPPSHRLGSNDFTDLDQATLFEHVRMLTDAGYLDAALWPYTTGQEAVSS